MPPSRLIARAATITALTLLSCIAIDAQAPARDQSQRGQTAGIQGRGGAQGQAAGPGQRGGGQGQTARDNPSSQPTMGTGSISGMLTLEGSGTPVRHARVTLSGAGLRPSRSTTTNDQGGFEFPSLPAGRFTLAASKPGYVDIIYGAKKPGRPGTSIQLADGQKLEKVSFSLPKGSVLTGVVVDENGEPSPGTQVRAMRYVLRTGERTLQQAGADTTDDRGIYRIYGQQPGDYIVSAIPRNANLNDLRQTMAAEIESLIQQAQAANATPGGPGAGGLGGGRGGGRGAQGLGNFANIVGGGRGQQLLDQAAALQAQLQQADQQQTVAYAPVVLPRHHHAGIRDDRDAGPRGGAQRRGPSTAARADGQDRRIGVELDGIDPAGRADSNQARGPIGVAVVPRPGHEHDARQAGRAILVQQRDAWAVHESPHERRFASRTRRSRTRVRPVSRNLAAAAAARAAAARARSRRSSGHPPTSPSPGRICRTSCSTCSRA